MSLKTAFALLKQNHHIDLGRKMKFFVGIKKLFLYITIVTLFFIGTTKTLASDYQYKILDPKYNPAAEKLLNGELQQSTITTSATEKKGFNFLRFLAIFASIGFPLFILYLATRAFKDVMESIPGSKESLPENVTFGNIKIEKETDEREVEISKLYNKKTTDTDIIKPKSPKLPEPSVETNSITDEITNLMNEAYNQNPSNSQKNIENNESGMVATVPIATKNPMLLNTAPLTKNKGLCLVEYENKYSLIGYIDKKVFFLNQFDSLKSSEIRPRLAERNEGKDRYIVRLDSYKGLIEVSDTEMNLLINL